MDATYTYGYDSARGTLTSIYSGQLRIVAETDGGGAVVSQFIYGTRSNCREHLRRIRRRRCHQA